MQAFLFIILFSVSATAQIIVSVHDWDTYKVLLNGKIQRVRLMNPDAPALDQYFGKVVRDSVAALIALPLKMPCKLWERKIITTPNLKGKCL
ncbi:hypothetical protein [Ferruginibacter profundus]